MIGPLANASDAVESLDKCVVEMERNIVYLVQLLGLMQEINSLIGYNKVVDQINYLGGLLFWMSILILQLILRIRSMLSCCLVDLQPRRERRGIHIIIATQKTDCRGY